MDRGEIPQMMLALTIRQRRVTAAVGILLGTRRVSYAQTASAALSYAHQRREIIDGVQMTSRPGAPSRGKPATGSIDIDALLSNARIASEFLKALSHEARLVILCMLVDGEKSVSEIEQALGMRQPAVSQQLARLRSDRLVDTRRDGKNIYYSLSRAETRDIIEALHNAFCHSKRGK